MITLPDKPHEEQYEDAVASLVRVLGYFAETRLILDHEGRQVLELDVVATPASKNYHEKILIEAKSGKTGFKDVFKVFGWRTFLDIPLGCIIRNEEPPQQDLDAFNEFAPAMKIDVKKFSLTETKKPQEVMAEVFEVEEKLRWQLFVSGWYAATSERLCYQGFNKFKKDNPDLDLVENIKEYDRACRIAFFEKDPLRRVSKLYKAFQKLPGISGACLAYIESKENISARDAQNKLFDTAEYPWAQYVMMLEHRARILIIKNAVEAIDTYNESDISSKLNLLITPDAFRDSFDYIKNHPHRFKIPYLLHLFVEVLGGFYVSHNGYSADLEMISDATGIPREDIVDCLNIINNFFPSEKGWFISYKNEVHTIKFFPAIWRGIGCFARQKYLFKDQYREIAPIMGWLLAQYHNVSYETLKPLLGVADEKA